MLQYIVDKQRPCPLPLTLFALIIFCFCISLRQVIFNPYVIVYVPMEQQIYETLNENDHIEDFYKLDELPKWDYSTLINFTKFRFDLNSIVCGGAPPHTNSPLIIIVVHSAPFNFKKRSVIRKTWGQQNPYIRLVFLMGSNERLQNLLIREHQKHHDIVQGNFFDSYINMTYKHVMALKYVSYYCQSAKYILKTDDDVFVNTPALIAYLKGEISPYGAKNLMLCKPVWDTQVKRSFRSKWRVSPKLYPNRKYPIYCPGFIIIYSPDVLFRLYRDAQLSEYFWIDDVHITGTIAQRANITPISILNLILTKNSAQKIVDSLHNHIDLNVYFLFGSENLNTNQIEKLWKYVNQFNRH